MQNEKLALQAKVASQDIAALSASEWFALEKKELQNKCELEKTDLEDQVAYAQSQATNLFQAKNTWLKDMEQMRDNKANLTDELKALQTNVDKIKFELQTWDSLQ